MPSRLMFTPFPRPEGGGSSPYTPPPQILHVSPSFLTPPFSYPAHHYTHTHTHANAHFSPSASSPPHFFKPDAASTFLAATSVRRFLVPLDAQPESSLKSHKRRSLALQRLLVDSDWRIGGRRQSRAAPPPALASPSRLRAERLGCPLGSGVAAGHAAAAAALAACQRCGWR